MKTLEKSPELLPLLKNFDVFKGLDEKALNWLIKRATYKQYEVGEPIFQPGFPADYMIIVLEGKYNIEIVSKGQLKDLGHREGGTVTGVLPFSRMKEAGATGTVSKPTQTLELHRDCFVEMVNTSYELTQRLVGLMSNRIREFSQVRFQDEKLTALGRLSAGLAHELNNPASAIVRDVAELYKKTHATPEKFKRVITMQITPEETDQINEILFSKLKNLNEIDLSLLEREEAVDDIVDWLEDHDVKGEIEDIADTFVDFGLTAEDLDTVDEIMDGKEISPLMSWFESTLSLEKMVTDIKEASERIASLIGAIKSYTHMDRGSAMELIDIHVGMKSTLIMLKHKIKQKRIIFDKQIDYDLPKIRAHAGELNQVWTNIFDNAIDAMDVDGVLGIKTFRNGNFVNVEISDNGSGIPEDILTLIFEPFFTTKGVGQGTGLGLDVVKRIIDKHNGSIKAESVPGKTVFTICFPIEE